MLAELLTVYTINADSLSICFKLHGFNKDIRLIVWNTARMDAEMTIVTSTVVGTHEWDFGTMRVILNADSGRQFGIIVTISSAITDEPNPAFAYLWQKLHLHLHAIVSNILSILITCYIWASYSSNVRLWVRAALSLGD